MEHLSVMKTLKNMLCGVPPSDLSRNTDINHRGVLTWFAMQIRIRGRNRSVFHRSQIMRLCYLMPFLFISLHKTPYFTETLDRKKNKFKSWQWQVCDWLAKWLIILGFMDLRWPRVYRRSNVGLVLLWVPKPFTTWVSGALLFKLLDALRHFKGKGVSNVSDSISMY